MMIASLVVTSDQMEMNGLLRWFFAWSFKVVKKERALVDCWGKGGRETIVLSSSSWPINFLNVILSTSISSWVLTEILKFSQNQRILRSIASVMSAISVHSPSSPTTIEYSLCSVKKRSGKKLSNCSIWCCCASCYVPKEDFILKCWELDLPLD